MRPRKSPEDLRSFRWFGKDDMRSWGHRSRAKQAGFTEEDLTGRPVIAILNTWSDANPCHAHFRQRAEDVKRGVWQAGGVPMEIPLLTLGETFERQQFAPETGQRKSLAGLWRGQVSDRSDSGRNILHGDGPSTFHVVYCESFATSKLDYFDD
jgi:hypothetical protein